MVAAGDLGGAYQATAPAFQEQTGEDAFQEAALRLGLTEYESSSWSSRNVENGQATLDGTITTRAGDEIPFNMTLIQVGQEWRVYSFSGTPTGAMARDSDRREKPSRKPETRTASAFSADRAPDRAQLKKLATDSLMSLNQAVQDQNFKAFYAATSEVWKEQTSAEELKAAFQSFIDAEVNMGGVADLDPVYNVDPYIDSDGLLDMSGHFPTSPYQVMFELQYVFEAPEWKLIGINVNLDNPEE